MGIYNEYIFKMKENEYWYGGIVDDGMKYPLSKESIYEADLEPNQSMNQSTPMLISNKGRYIWCNSGFKVRVENGEIKILSKKDEPLIYKDGDTLKEGFLSVSNKFFPANGVVPPSDFFIKPQYNTWIELLYNQTQDGVLNYARSIIEKEMPVGIIMIDDGWNDYYGRWKFNVDKFPNPKEMVKELHDLGFKVMLWTCPFVSPDSIEFRELEKKEYLVRNTHGDVSIKKWWNGYSAVLDITNPEAVKWYHNQNSELMKSYGIDGFKFDAGDARFYSDEDVTYKKIDANKHSELWAELGLAYEYNEYRACFKVGGKHLVQRLADKNHSWGGNGVSSLIPNQLTQGILGYSYTCPDMIGGGEYSNFLSNSDNLDEELFVRYSQCAALMPMMQFSAAPWRVLSSEKFEICKEAAWIHVKYASYIYELAINSSKTGEPIVRYMEYSFPGEGLEKVTNQFMLGDKYLVAPVIEKDAIERTVMLPIGVWKGIGDNIIREIKETTEEVIKSPIDKIIIFEKIDDNGSIT